MGRTHARHEAGEAGAVDPGVFLAAVGVFLRHWNFTRQVMGMPCS